MPVYLAMSFLAITAYSATIDGRWKMSLTAPEGSTYFTMTVELDGESANGHVGEALFNGTYKDGD